MSPVFAHGQLRLYLLALLADGPRHGYEVIQDLEQRFHGLYSPSAGTVYPRLAKLEEEGLVERMAEGRKATYRITEAGRAEVAARWAAVEDLHSDLEDSVRQLAQEVRDRVQSQTRDLRTELREAARVARANATPVGGHDVSWGATDVGSITDLERAMNELRAEARQAWRRRGLSPGQTRQIVTVLRDASQRIRTVISEG